MYNDAMIIYLYGKDTRRSREHLGKLVEKFGRERDPQGLNTKRVVVSPKTSAKAAADGGVDCSVARAELMSAPFLAEKRMVVVERVLERGDEEFLVWFKARFLESEPPADVIVVLWEEEPVKKSAADAAHQIHATLAASKFAQEFTPLEGRKREEWIVRAVAERGGQITSEAAADLARRVEDDNELMNTVDMLVAHGSPISSHDLNIFLPPDIEKTIFEAMDALSNRDHRKATMLLSNVWLVDNDPVYIFAMLHRQVRLLLYTREILDDNPQIFESALAKTLAVHPFAAKRLVQQASHWTRAELVKMYTSLHEIDYAMKHGSVGARMFIDKLVAI